jgi:hypothetical protein
LRQAADSVSGATGFSNALHSELFRRAVIFAVVLVRDLGFPCFAKVEYGVVCGFTVNAIRRPCRVVCWTERDGRIAREFLAQVGEWLKPTDCKSVPPSEVRRFESFPVHHDFVNRLSIALVCYVGLGALTWVTITDPKLRAGTLAILALFAVKSVLRRKDGLDANRLDANGKSDSE